VKICFTVPGKPVAKQRPKFARMGSFVRTYTPKETMSYESMVRYAAAEAMGEDAPIEGPIELLVEIGLQIPVSASRKQQARMASNQIMPTKKPDGDNVLKAIKDACNGVVWRDDAQVVDGHYRKRYSITPGVRVTVDVVHTVEPLVMQQEALVLPMAQAAAHPF
jgi:Holliday junction resolvase RusA-like endonuclease